MSLNSGEVMTDQRSQAGPIHLGHGSDPAMAEEGGSQFSAEGSLGLFQNFEDLVFVECDVVLVGGLRHD